ncbi:hypothetical protein AYO22_10980 [Fonsecaea multimorphosa]|nr:hypothetical protein AYO22_10980 [Fonsecaea multimorphosa]
MAAEATKHWQQVVKERAYALSQVPMGKPRKLKVIVAGAGISGLCFAHEVQSGSIQAVDLTIYEKNSSVGGTWFENRYPGCACDIPIHNYQFSWAPYPYFSSYYAGSGEIRNYLERVADQFELRQHIKTSHKIVGAMWQPDRQRWHVTVRRTDGRDLVVSSRTEADTEAGETFVEECDIFVNACGYVNDWRWPSIPGRLEFEGKMYHSAAWDPKADLIDQTVALIGNGSSGIQILPSIIDKAKKVYVFIRSPTWITAGFASKFAGPGGSNVIFSEEQKKHWADNPEAYLAYRKEVEMELNSRFRLYIKDTEDQKNAQKFSTKAMVDKLSQKPELAKLLLPDFAVGCVLQHWLASLENVIWGEIDRFTPTGLRSASSGEEVTVDTIICATGFDISFSPRYPIIGRNGVNLQDKWDKSPESYLSVLAEDMPNYFVYLGPASPIGHGSLVGSVEIITSYIGDLIKKLQQENYSSFCLKPGLAAAWKNHCLAWLEKTAWNSPCVSTYKNGTKDGSLVSLHGGSRLHYFSLLRRKRYEDIDWTSLCSDLPFAWLNNGFTVEETDDREKSDLTWYLNPVGKHAILQPPKATSGENGASGDNGHV